MSDAGTVERAMELARSGTVRNVDDIRRTLQREQREGVDAHLASDTFKKQLKRLIAKRLEAENG